jgi:hypothetical protein
VTADRSAAAGELHKDGDSPSEAKPQTFRSPVAVIIWWVWVLFAAGNLIDLAVQGRDHTAAVAAVILVFVTGVVYVTAQRPKVIASDDGITLKNPLRDHLIGWGAITKFDTIDLLRVHCEWPGPDGTQRKVIHAWAVQHSRRRDMTRQVRAARRSTRGSFGSSPSVPSTIVRPGTPQTQVGTAEHAVDSLKARLETASRSHPPASPPRSLWCWQPIAALLLPAILLVIIALT